jgi:hypothetical protein
MNRKFDTMGLRLLFAAGFGVMFIGMLVLVFSVGFGGPPPSLREENAAKWTGAAILIAGALLSIGTAVRLYIVENRPRS